MAKEGKETIHRSLIKSFTLLAELIFVGEKIRKKKCYALIFIRQFTVSSFLGLLSVCPLAYRYPFTFRYEKIVHKPKFRIRQQLFLILVLRTALLLLLFHPFIYDTVLVQRDP
jgi:hypothetical protein